MGKCGTYKDGPGDTPGFTNHIMIWDLPSPVGEQTVPWRDQTGIGKVSASTWFITARYGNIVNTVDATSNDDVQRLAVRDVRIYADQAGRLILDALE